MYEFGWTPEVWESLSFREKAMVIAGIKIHLEEEQKANKKAEHQANRAKHRKH